MTYTPDILVVSGVYMRRNYLVGQRFTRLQVTEIAGLDARSNVKWRCRCDCGRYTTAYAYDLKANKVKSCGCLAKEGTKTLHGYASAGSTRSRIYAIWASMIQRCTNPNNRSFAHYGGRGVTVCQHWMEFQNFIADMGEPPVGMSLDRRDNNRGYSKDNCHWATHQTQNKNKRSNVTVIINGDTVVLVDAIARLRKTKSSFYYLKRKLGLTAQGVIDLWLVQKNPL